MSNRRSGGPPPRGGNRFSQPFSSASVSPWQGNALNQSGIISQLTTNPQIALALTSLLQPQQQQPPSLLTLNTSDFSHNRDYGRFGGGRSRDFRRHEPYVKGRGGWRTDRRVNKRPQNDKRREEKKPEPKKEDKEKNELQEGMNEPINSPMEEPVEEEKEIKRDWKDEKNQTEGKEDVEDDIKIPNDTQAKEGRFVGVPAKYLNCFVCNKQMWDGESMGKHLKGRAHYEMLKALEESIHICVNILRENMRLSEERKVIELNRQNRLRKYSDRKHFNEPNSHCNMCDLKFLGKIVTHRRSNDHQRLKRYLHPTCRICDKEFPSRVEWIEHRLTPEHLLKIHEISEKSGGGRDGDELILVKTESTDNDTTTPAEAIVTENQSQVLPGRDPDDDLQCLDLEPLLEEPLQMESENPILELDEVLDGLQNRVPSYKRDRKVSVKSLQPFTGFVCNLCHRSFIDEQDAQDHLKTKKHYYKFVEALREQFERNERRSKATEQDIKQESGDTENPESSQENDEPSNVVDMENTTEIKKEDDEDAEMYDPAVHTESNVDEDEVNTLHVMDGEDADAPILVADEDEDESQDVDTVTSTDQSISVTTATDTAVTEQSKPIIVTTETIVPMQPKPVIKSIQQKVPQINQTSTAAVGLTSSYIPQQNLQGIQRRSNVRNGAGPRSRRGRRIM